jgi:hypothetical protein
MDRIATRQHQRAWMIECVRWQSGSRLPSMVVVCLHNCTLRTSPFDACQEVLRRSRDHGP